MITEQITQRNYCLIIRDNSTKNRVNEVKEIIKELSSKILKEMNIPRRSDLTILELKYPSANASQDAFNKFFDSSTVFARLYNNFVGCQVIDISDWVNETHSERFNELLNYFRKNAINSRFIILAPVTDTKSATRVLAVLSTALEISPIYLESQMLLNEWIEQGRLNVFINQTNGVNLLIKAILNCGNISDLDFTQIQLITRKHLVLFDETFLSFVISEKDSKRKIGF